MASRRTVAALACLLLSGLVVGGSGASIAFAEPDAGNGGNTDGGDSNGSAGHSRPGFGFGIGQRPGASSGGGAVDAPNTIGNQSPGDFGVHLPTRPGAVIGNGRNGRTGILPRIGDLAPSGSGAPPAASVPSKAGAPSAGPGAAAPPVLLPTPTETATGSTTAPTSALPAVPQVGDAGGGTGSRGWWTGPKLPQVGSLDQDQGGATVPLAVPRVALPTTLPAEVFSAIGRVADQVTGLATAAAALPFASVPLPVVVPPVGAPGGVTDRGGRGAAGSATPRVPPTASIGGAPAITGKVGTPQDDPPRPKDSQPFEADDLLASEMTYRAGYDDYLRAAGVGKVAAVAVPGVSGILLLTGAGGLIGYRQARAGSAVRSGGPGRFMN